MFLLSRRFFYNYDCNGGQEKKKTCVWARRLFRRRAKLVCDHSLVRELQLADVVVYTGIMRVGVDTLNDLLQLIEPYISGSDLIRWRTNWRHQPAALWFAVTCYKQSTMNQNINTSMLCTRSLLVASYRTCDHSLKRLGSMVVFRCVWSTCAVDANVYFRLKSEKHEMFVSVKSNTTQLNWTQLNSTSSCRHVHSVNNCHVSMNVVTQLTQFIGHDVINKNTTDLAIRCSTGSFEFSSVELSCVALNTP